MRVRLLFPVAWAVMLSCGAPLEETPIRGNDGPVARAVARALAVFASSAGPEVRVASIRVAPGRGDGRYNKVTHQIRIDPHPSVGAELATTHELCHAADLQFDLSKGVEPLITRGPDPTKRDVREGWAEVCSVGPLDVWLATQVVCPADQGTSDVEHMLRDRLYQHPPLTFAAVEGSPVEVARIDFQEVADAHISTCAVDSDTGVLGFWVDSAESGNGKLVFAHVWTGLPADPRDFAAFSDPGRTSAWPTPWRVDGEVDVDLGTVGLAQRLSASSELLRILTFDGERWGVATACVPSTACLFSFAGSAWTIAPDAFGAAWSRLDLEIAPP